jgi:hypothetical protein
MGALMKRYSLLVLFSLFAAITWADDARAVYIVRSVGTSSADPWTANMLVPTEAVRLYTPSRFSRKGTSVDISMSADISFSVSGSREIERSKLNILYRFDVTIAGSKPLPKPDKVVSVRFSLSELLKKGGPSSQSPGFYALRKVIASSSFKKGSAWIQAIEYDGEGRFTAKVALKKD